MKHIFQKSLAILVFLCILTLAAFLRLSGNNWDQGQHLNPDERFLTMVATAMVWPKDFLAYLDTANSQLNPHNLKFDFYVYGTWPVIVVKFVAEKLQFGDYGNLTKVGRAMSGVCDILTMIVVFLIGKRIGELFTHHNTSSIKPIDILAGIFSMLVYALMALPIQLAHFYTTDPYLTLFLTTAVYLLLFPPIPLIGALLGVSTGLALGAKISGILILPVIGLYGLTTLYTTYNDFKKDKIILKEKLKLKAVQLTVFYLLFTAFFYLSFRLSMPYLFSNSKLFTISLNEKVLANWKALEGFNTYDTWVPPSIQWIHQKKILFPLLNMIFIGLGLPLTLVGVTGLLWCCAQLRKHPYLLLIGGSLAVTFFYQGTQFALPLRYFLPMYPLLATLTGLFLRHVFITNGNTAKNKILLICLVLSLFIWPISVVNMYNQLHPRFRASEWIFKNVPPNTKISFEHWDDGLPLNLPGYGTGSYPGVEFPMYGRDDKDKWTDIIAKLNTTEYLVLSSNRVYASITSFPERYPVSLRFYSLLFAEKLGYTKVAEFITRPSFPFFINTCVSLPFFTYGTVDKAGSSNGPLRHKCSGIEFVDDYVDETWTVYDHPKVTIFRKDPSYQSPMFLLSEIQEN